MTGRERERGFWRAGHVLHVDLSKEMINTEYRALAFQDKGEEARPKVSWSSDVLFLGWVSSIGTFIF